MPNPASATPPGIAFALPNFAAYAGLLPPAWIAAPKVDFTYSVVYGTNSTGTALAASAVNQTASVTINNDADFLVTSIYGRVTVAADNALLGTPTPVMVLISDSSGVQWMDQAVHFDNLISFVQNQAFEPFPRAVKRNTTVTTSLTNLIATAGHVVISFRGFKVYTGMTWAQLGY